MTSPFTKILIANRGEIALRVMRSARALGYRTVAVYSSADADARHVREADQALCIGGPLPAQSYLNIPALIELISSVMTLNPGDVIASGTPEGVGPIVPGDSIRIGIESVGEMTLPVVEAAQFSPRRF